ncbi:hypothetical protein [Goodfellowiella coeruleoviolacea]|nr:hypothetical protein [Goodfellowiella coeruleoviolacea]
MTMDQITTLLQLAATDDRRTIGYAEKSAWSSAAQIGGWTYEEAAEAIRYHQATNREYLRAAHITQRIEFARRVARIDQDAGAIAQSGATLPSHAEAVDLWAGDMRAAGANPTCEQRQKAGELLAELLDGAPDASLVLTAAVLAARKFSARIDLELLRLGRDPWEGMLPIPVQYQPDDRVDLFRALQRGLSARWASYEAVEPPEWVTAHEADVRPRIDGNFLAEPDWDHTTPEGEQRWFEEGSAWSEREFRVRQWHKQDLARWTAEQVAAARAWYSAHPEWREECIQLQEGRNAS